MSDGSLKHAWLSDMDPVWVPLKQECDKLFEKFWALPTDQYQEAWKQNPLVMPEGTPLDLEVWTKNIPVRHGAQIELKFFKNTKALESKGSEGTKAPWMIVAHGGGWILGNHDVEGEFLGGQRRCPAPLSSVSISDCKLGASFLDGPTATYSHSKSPYRAPKYRYPTQIQDYYDAYKWCKDNASSLGIDPEACITSGSSAGGNMAAVLPTMAWDNGEKGIIGQMLNGPVMCHPKHFPKDEGYEYNSWEQNAHASILGKANMLACWETYYPNTGPDVYANPLLVKTVDGLPPALIQISGMDPLRDEAFAWADRLAEAKIAVEIKTFPGLPHGFYTFPQLEATTIYFKKAASWVQELLAARGWTI